VKFKNEFAVSRTLRRLHARWKRCRLPGATRPGAGAGQPGFAEKAWEILLNVQSAPGAGAALHPLLTERAEEVKNILIVLITSDRGLAGAFNTNIIRVAQPFCRAIG
jgi:hypothetical protein